jgi:hypothetical protein
LATRIASAIGAKSARKCTELLFTRIACCVGSMPMKRYSSWSAICGFSHVTTTRTPPIFRHAEGPRLMRAPR